MQSSPCQLCVIVYSPELTAKVTRELFGRRERGGTTERGGQADGTYSGALAFHYFTSVILVFGIVVIAIINILIELIELIELL